MAESDLVEGLIGGDFDLEGTPDLASPGAAEGATGAPAPGEYQAAEADLAAASARAPRFADPLKAWGDLLAQGRWRQALVKYDDAMKYAPAWKQLHEARRIAAKGLR